MLTRFRKNTLFQQILIAGVSPALLLFFSLFTYSLVTRLNDASQSQLEIATRIAENIAASSELAIISDNESQLLDIMRSALSKDIIAISIVNSLTGNQSYLKSNNKNQQATESLSVPIYQSSIEINDAITGDTDNISDAPTIIGEVRIERSTDQLSKLQQKIIVVSSVIGVLSISLCILMAWLISRRLSKPLAEINYFTKNISAGNLGDRLTVKGEGELAELQNHINEMAKSLESHQLELTNKLAQLEVAKAEADAANNAKSLFLATMTHEIRTPMNGALGMLQLLSTTELNQEQNHYIEIAKSSSEHLLNIVNNILDFSKIEKGDLKLDKRLFSPTSLFDTLLTPLAYEAKEKGLEFNYVISPELQNIEIYGDDTRIKQIILNLASNAVKFTHDGSIAIALQGKPINQHQLKVTLTVTDTGIGIEEAIHNSVFDSFYQADGSNQRRYGGSGLGLAIVKRLCELMNASIQMTSTVSKGSQFTISWHCEYKEQVDEAAHDVAVPTSILAGKKVLIVEDNPVNQMLVANIVKRWDMQVITSNNGEECLHVLQQQKVDLILMDLQMPVMDGYETCKQIRQQAELASLPIIALTANSVQEDKDRCFAVGMNDFLSKPVSIHTLNEKVRYWISATRRDNSH